MVIGGIDFNAGMCTGDMSYPKGDLTWEKLSDEQVINIIDGVKDYVDEAVVNSDLLVKPRLWGARSSRWPKIRKEHLSRQGSCQACGLTSPQWLNVHHIEPYHINPDRELDETNLITLCEWPARNHHLIFGHLGDYSSYNVDVIKDCEYYFKKLRNKP